MDPIIAIVGNVFQSPEAEGAAIDIGRELAKGGFRLMVYHSDPNYLEAPVVKGYVDSQVARPRSIEVRYPLHQYKPSFPEQMTHGQLFDMRPDSSKDWEASFYQSLKEVDGILLVRGGQSTLIAGFVAMGHGAAVVSLAAMGDAASRIWESIRPGRDLPSADEISLMASPQWSSDRAADCVKALRDQLERRAEAVRQQRLAELRRDSSLRQHAVWAAAVFLLAIASIPLSWGQKLSLPVAIAVLFVSPLLAGVAGSTIRHVFDLRQGSLPLSTESSVTTAALGLIAGGVAGILFVTAQVTTVGDQITGEQASRLVPFGVVIGFIAGLTLDAVFRKLIATDVVETSAIEAKRRP